MLSEAVFNIKTEEEFHNTALKVFRYQYTHSPVYRRFCEFLKKDTYNVREIKDIPFLPIQFFKSERILCEGLSEQLIFTSSGTTGSNVSKHYVTDLNLYEQSFLKAFEIFYGNISDLVVLALLPSYLERQGSSLIYMAERLIKDSGSEDSGFYLHDLDGLASKLRDLDRSGKRVLLIGVSFALLDLIEKHHFNLENTIIMETGGMKGKRKELIREELHQLLSDGFGVKHIHSEYGMTELLSQAYSKGEGLFECPPWMKILSRDPEDALSLQHAGKTGGINIIDLANINSCSFIATQDLGRVNNDGSFEIIGRFDNSDIRGCNLMVI